MSQAGILNLDGNLPPDVATQYITDMGTAIPAANILNVLGLGGTVTSATGDTIFIDSTGAIGVSQITATAPLTANGISGVPQLGAITLAANNATTTTVGVASFNATNFSVSSGAVSSQDFTIVAGTGLSGGGSLTLGGSVTLDVDGTFGVTSVTGTVNQITASPTSGNVILSFTDGISIGSYQSTTPPTGGIIAPGSVGIGTDTPSFRLTATETSPSALAYQLQLQNADNNNGTASSILFTTSTNGSVGKGGIAYVRNLSSARGDFYFLQNTSVIGTDLPTVADVAMIITNDRKVLMGVVADTPVASTVGSAIQIGGVTGSSYQNLSYSTLYNSNTSTSGVLSFGKGRGSSIGAVTIVQDGDFFGQIRFAGANGVNFQSIGAAIRAQVSGTPSSTSMPGKLIFSTTASGAVASTDRLYLDSNGNFGVRVAAPTSYLHLAAGTATASTSPLKFTTGINLTAPEAGVMEFSSSVFYLTSVATREAIALMSSSFLTNHGVVLGTGTSTLGATSVGATGTVLAGNTGADPTFQLLTSIAVTSITATAPLTANATSGVAQTGNVTIALTTPLSLSFGGTNANLTASNGGVFYSTATAGAILSGTATANQILMSGASAAPSWSSSTYPTSVAQGDLLFGSAINVISTLSKNTTATRYLSNTGTSNNPAWAQVNLSNGVTSTLPVGNGGTGKTTFTAFSVICAGTTATGAFQNVSGVGSTGQILASNGAGALPSWTSLGTLGVTSVTGTANQITASPTIGDVVVSFTDGISIGSYQATTPPTGGIIAPGDVGIGTNAPSFRLSVTETLTDNLAYQLQLQNSANTTGTAAAMLFTTSENGSVGKGGIAYVRSLSSARGDFYFLQNTSTTGSVLPSVSDVAMIITNGRKVGIGSGFTSPVSWLHVYENDSSTNAAAGITVENEGSGDAVVQYLITGVKRWVTGIDNSDSEKFKFSPTVDLSSAPVMTITVDGAVGIGTTSPAASRLDVVDNTFTNVTSATYLSEFLSTDTPSTGSTSTFYNLQIDQVLNTSTAAFSNGDSISPRNLGVNARSIAGGGTNNITSMGGGKFEARANQSGGTISNNVGLIGQGTVSGNNTVSANYGVYAISTIASGSSANVSTATGIRSIAYHSGSGTLTNNFGIYTESRATIASAVITNNYGSFFRTQTIAGSTITNNYGVYIDEVTGGTITNNWALYVAPTANSYFAGNIGLGITTPLNKIQIGSANTRSIYLDTASNAGGFGFYSSFFGTNVSVDSSGNVTRYSDGNRRGGAIVNNSGTFQFSTFLENTAPGDVTSSYTDYLTSFLRMVITSSGKVGIGVATPTAYLHLIGGTTSATTAPLKFTSGTLMTAPEAGAIEYNGTFYLTNSTPTRRPIALGPSGASSTDNAIARWDGTSGAILKNSGVIIDNSDNVTGVTTLNIDGISAAALVVNTSTLAVTSSSNRVGVNIASPASRLHVFGSDAATGTSAGITVESSNASGDAIVQFLLSNSGQRWVVGADNSASDAFVISSTADLSTPRMTIATTGQVGIGTPPNSVNQLYVTQSLSLASSSAFSALKLETGLTPPLASTYSSVSSINTEISSSGTGTVTTLYGIRSTVSKGMSTTTADAYTAYFAGPSNSSGTLTNAYSLYLTNPSGTGITNSYTAILGDAAGSLVGIGTNVPISPLYVLESSSGDGGSTGINVENAGSGDAAIHFRAGSAVWSAGVDNSDSDKFKISRSGNLATTTSVTITTAGAVGIGTATPNASSILDVASTTLGFLPPVMTTAQKNAISSPTAGLEVFDSTLAIPQFWNGSYWRGLGIFLIETQTASSVASLTFVIPSDITEILLIGTNITYPATTAGFLQLQLSTDGGSGFVTTGYASGCNQSAYNSTAMANANITTGLIITPNTNSVASRSISFTHNIYGFNLSNALFYTGQGTVADNSNAFFGTMGGSSLASAVANAFRLNWTTGINWSGTISVYGFY